MIKISNFLILLTCSLIVKRNDAIEVPDITLEAYTPKGLKVTIPATNGIQFVAFHANVNRNINQVDLGELSIDIAKPVNNVFSGFIPDAQLKKGDTLHFWIFIQRDKLGYKLDGQSRTIDELLEMKDSQCNPSKTLVAGKSVVCQGSVIFEDKFQSTKISSSSKWIVEQYVPILGPDFEFVAYKNTANTVYVLDNMLHISPRALERWQEVLEPLDYGSVCTQPRQCQWNPDKVFIAPPVHSGQISSQFSFKYGEVEVRAKLPAGDWIYPQVQLQEINNASHKLLIGYARGNTELKSSNGQDIGSRLLYAGPIMAESEPLRSNFLQNKKNDEPLTKTMHTYKVKWTPDLMEFYLDGVSYAKIENPALQQIGFAQDTTVKLVLGVGVGGLNDFPDNSISGVNPKPWSNNGRTVFKNFFTKQNTWANTWSQGLSELQVDYVKITAL